VIDPDTMITYSLVYQDHGNTTWYVLENPLYEHKAPSAHHDATYDLAEAQAVARLVLEGMPYPIKPHRSPVGPVAAVQIIQAVNIGGVIMTFGTPNEEDTTA